eukprot:3032887-Pyramimonas_sp.AAC.1
MSAYLSYAGPRGGAPTHISSPPPQVEPGDRQQAPKRPSRGPKEAPRGPQTVLGTSAPGF